MTKTNLLTVLKAIGDLSDDGFFLYNVKPGLLEYTNLALRNLFDISHVAFANQPAFFTNHIIPEDIDYLRGEFDRIFTEHKLQNVEFRIKSHDGSLKDVSCSAYMIEQNKFIVGVLRDVTFIREHEDYIINYGAKKDALLEMVNHNLSGPLTVSKHIIDSLENAASTQTNANLNAHIQLIKENTRHCIELVNDFLEEEHLVSEHIFTKRNRFEVTDKVNTVLERFRKSYPDYEFILIKNFDQLYVNNDDVKFLQVLNNLVSNALKWSTTGSKIQVNLQEHGDNFVLAVKDHGIGIPDHFKLTIFQKHTPASRQGLRGERSTGMGLYIVKKLVHLMNGTITFESKENEGSTFFVTLAKEANGDKKAANAFGAGNSGN